MKRKGQLLAILMMAVLILSFAGCKAAPTPSPSPSQQPSDKPVATLPTSPTKTPETPGVATKVVRVLVAELPLKDGINSLTGREYEGLENMVKRLFTKNGHEDITVELTSLPFSGIEQAQQQALTQKTADILLISGQHAAQYYNDGLIRSIDDLLEADESFDPYSLYISGLFDSVRVMDYSITEHIALPVSAAQSYIMQDAQLFLQWGEDLLPENPTPAQVLAKAKAMTGRNPVSGAQNYGLYFDPQDPNGAVLVSLLNYYYAESGSGNMANAGDINWTINTPEFKNALKWMDEAAQMMPPGIAEGLGGDKKMQVDNDVAIYLNANGVQEMTRYLASLEGTWISRDRPALNMGHDGAGFINFDVAVMSRGTQNEQAAWEVMKFFSGYEMQKWLYEQFIMAPTVANQDFLLPVDDYAKTNQKVLEASHIDPLFDVQNPFFKDDIVPFVAQYIKDRSAGIARDMEKDLVVLQQKAEDWTALFK